MNDKNTNSNTNIDTNNNNSTHSNNINNATSISFDNHTYNMKHDTDSNNNATSNTDNITTDNNTQSNNTNSSIDTIIHSNSIPINNTNITTQRHNSIMDDIDEEKSYHNDTHEAVLSTSLNALHLNNNHNNHLLHNNLDTSDNTTISMPDHVHDLDDVYIQQNINNIHPSTLPNTQFPLQSSQSQHDIGQRQLTRRALNASIDRAAALKSSSSLARFSVNTVDKLTPNMVKNFTVNKWKAYGDPLINYLDYNIDNVMNVIDSTGFLPQSIQTYTSPMMTPQQHHIHNNNTATQSPLVLPQSQHQQQINDNNNTTSLHDRSSPSDNSTSIDSPGSVALDRHTELMLLDKDARTMYQQYWERLKEKFVHSIWYNRVDEILLQNIVVKTFSQRVAHLQRPAEVFYNTVTEEYMSHNTYEDFLQALIAKLGPAWDDRLAPLGM